MIKSSYKKDKKIFEDSSLFADSNIQLGQCLQNNKVKNILNPNEINISGTNDSGGTRTYSIYKVDMTNYSVNTIYTKTGSSLSGPDSTYIGLKKIEQ